MKSKEEILENIIEGPNKQKPLSKDQKEAVKSNARYIRILAGAGAGKTETLTRRILYLLLYKNINPEDIVAFTFTEKAAQSMKSRIYSRVTELMGEEYAAKLGKMYVGTIHSFALRILQDYFEYGNYDVLDENQEMAFIMKRGWEIGIQNLDGDNYGEKCQKFVEAVNVIYDELIDREELKNKEPEFYKVFEKYEKILDEYHRLTFSRLIYLAVTKIKEHGEKLPEIKHLIVDEYQDINHAQEELIKLLGENASIMVVGDPRQTIYQWRGSDDGCFERFANVLYPSAHKITIPENRRSGRKIVEIGNSVADTFEKRKFEPMEKFRKEEGYVYVRIAETPQEEAEWIAEQIEYLVKEENLNYSDFGILLRSVSTSGEPFIKEFKRRGIPYVVGGAVGLFRREEATAVGKLFAWLHNEGFWKDYRGYVRYEDLVDSALVDWRNATGLISEVDRDKIKDELDKWKNEIRGGKYHNFQEAYHALLNILRFKELDPENKLHAAVMANLGRFSNLLGDYENAVRLGGNKFGWTQSNLKGLVWYLYLYATSAYEEQLSEDIRGIDAVQITTVHQAKGLEWMVVFIPAMVYRRFPSSHVGEERRWLISRELFPADRYDLKKDDEKRLFYVAVTRAKSTLVLSCFKRINKSVRISEFLEEILSKHPTIIEAISTNGKIKIDKSFIRATDEELSTFDAGEIVDYTKCPYFFRLRHVWNYDAPINEELGYGNALHYCLRRAAELHREKGYNPFSAIMESVVKGFYLPYAPPQKIQNMREGAKKILLNYVAKYIDDIESVAEVEYRLEFPRKNSTIAGKVDVIIERNGEVEVREYKTSTKVTTPERVAFQVRLYALGLRALGFNVKKGSTVYLSEEKLDRVSVEEKDLETAKYNAEKIIENINKQKYNATPGEFCDICDFKNICRWRKEVIVDESTK